MRLAKTIWDSEKAQKTQFWLKSQGIQVQLQPHPQPNPTCWRLWVLEEDQLPVVKKWLEEIDNSSLDLDQQLATLPQAIAFEIDKPASITGPKDKKRLSLFKQEWLIKTLAACLICIHALLTLFLTPHQSREAQLALLIDEPGVTASKSTVWTGFYSTALRKIQKKGGSADYSPLFVKVKQGQVWRLFTPSLVHADWLHLAFNILWLLTLGPHIEKRVPRLRILIFIVTSAMISNICQYLMGGAQFLGFSGVITAMIGFCYARVCLYPWESYPIPSSTFSFIGFYLILTLCLQTISFIVEALGFAPFSFGIANTAHLSGLLVGWLIGRTSWMSLKS